MPRYLFFEPMTLFLECMIARANGVLQGRGSACHCLTLARVGMSCYEVRVWMVVILFLVGWTL